LNWHAPTEQDLNGEGEHVFLVDIQPDIVPHQSMTDGDALLRINKSGWSWCVLDTRVDLIVMLGHCDTKEAAIGEAQAALGELRA
jgi:hypothetical protein